MALWSTFTLIACNCLLPSSCMQFPRKLVSHSELERDLPSTLVSTDDAGARILAAYDTSAKGISELLSKSTLPRGFCQGSWTRPPIIVGGLSDSGTRGALSILSNYLGVGMTPKRHQESSGDDHYMNLAIGSWYKMLDEINGHITSASYADTSMFDNASVQLCEAVKHDWELNTKSSSIWGFKSPRSILMVPVWDLLFGSEFKFVHVVRDPRSACEPGTNRVQFNNVCDLLLSDSECLGIEGCFRYWTRVNGDVWDFFGGSRNPQYAYFSMDRIVNSSLASGMLQSEIAKLDLQVNLEEILATLVQDESSYASTFAATPDIERIMVPALASFVANDTRAHFVLTELGYRAASFGILSTYG